jgi:hypothetical protein
MDPIRANPSSNVEFHLVCPLCEFGAEIGHLGLEWDVVFVIMLGSECELRLVIQLFLASPMKGLEDHSQALMLFIEAPDKAFLLKMDGHVVHMCSERDQFVLLMSDMFNRIFNEVGMDSAHDVMNCTISITACIGHHIMHGGAKNIFSKHGGVG